MRKGRIVGTTLIAVWTLAMGVACGPEGTEPEGTEPQKLGTVETMLRAPSYTCSCSDHVGTWSGTYPSQFAAEADLYYYCRDMNNNGTYGACTAL